MSVIDDEEVELEMLKNQSPCETTRVRRPLRTQIMTNAIILPKFNDLRHYFKVKVEKARQSRYRPRRAQL